MTIHFSNSPLFPASPIPRREPEYAYKAHKGLGETIDQINHIINPDTICRAQRDYWVAKSMSLLAQVLELENRLKTTLADD